MANRSAAEEEKRKAIHSAEPLRMPPRLTRAAQNLERLFLTLFDPSEIQLGGGTILAARYGHRTSHDLDYWYNDEAAQRLVEQGNEYAWEMMMGSEGQLDEKRTTLLRGCAGRMLGVEFSLGRSNEGAWIDGGQKIYGSQIRAQSTTMILAGKILKRWRVDNRPVPIRDLVDVSVAARIEPEAVEKVLEVCEPREQAEIIKRLRATPANQHKEDPKKITSIKYKIRLEELAQQMIRMVETGSADSAPEATPMGALAARTRIQPRTELGL